MIKIEKWNDLKQLPQKSKWDVFYEYVRQHSNYKVIVFGAGDQGFMAARFMHNNGVEVHGFCDNNKKIWGTYLKGLPVYSPKEAVALGENVLFVNLDSYRMEKQQQLLSLGVRHQRIIALDLFSPLSSGLTRDYIEAHEEEFQSILPLLADEESRHVYLNYLAGAWTGNLEYFSSIQNGGGDTFLKI